ncbi:MAG: hypothetical protein IJA72_02900 [Clostridia bacterium]|nr:hypothetical protein [Clostridia bacterium]
MANFKKIIRNNAPNTLKEQGYQGQCRVLKGEEYENALHSLFLQTLDEAEACNFKAKVKTMYADMLEMIKALMAHNKISAKDVSLSINQPMQWYDSFDTEEIRSARAKTNLLNRFAELKIIKSKEVKKDQFKEIFNAFNTFIEAKNYTLSSIEKWRLAIREKLGDYSKGIYLEEVVKVKRHTI